MNVTINCVTYRLNRDTDLVALITAKSAADVEALVKRLPVVRDVPRAA